MKGGETIWRHWKHSLRVYEGLSPRLRKGRRSTASRIVALQRRIFRRSMRGKTV
nr:MAG TPA: hypothetical protein [Caudoviricetes sp.]